MWSGGGRGVGGEIDTLDLRAGPMNPETVLRGLAEPGRGRQRGVARAGGT